ncbi:hypothetical protein B0H21DRAFT_693672, partial [Amylocystis lapponica]
LITAISEDQSIKCGLYPPPGGNTSSAKGGGKGKTEHHWAICEVLFTDHPRYKARFALVPGDKKQEKAWGLKVKNRLKM